ncbi:MAG TPA: S9 family peptidase [Steroidobacteraceae bacterium]|nr:S9 family peptidase [Steroidobacteraceae bacterium]
MSRHFRDANLTDNVRKLLRQSGQGKSQWIAILLMFASAYAFAEPYSAAAMWQLQRLGDPAISPDGRLAVVPVTEYDVEKNRGLTHLWLVPTKPGKARQLTSAEASDSSPIFSPDGESIAFVSRRGEDKESQIYVIAVNGGEARRVTNVPTGAESPKWLPDSKRIAFITRVWPDTKTWQEVEARVKERADSKMTAQVWTKAPISYWDHFLDDREAHVFVADIEGGAARAITQGSGLALDASDPDVNSYDISPDGTEIAFAANVDRTGVDPNFDVFVMPIEGGSPRNLTSDNPADDGSPIYSPDGKRIAFQRQTIKGFYADRVRVMIYERRAQTTRDITEGWDRSAEGLVWSPDSDALFGAVNDAAVRRIFRFDLSGGTPQPITRGRSFSSLAIGGSGPTLIALRQSFSEPPTLVSVIARNGTATKLTDFNDAALARLNTGKTESVTYAGANGDPVQMWIVYPPNFTPDRKWPLYLLLHGGPHNGVEDAYQWRWNAQIFASWGYVTAWHNFHGSSGFGQAWADSITRDWADLPYEDTIKAAQWFADKPWIDAERMAAGGGSFGGYLAALLLGREHPFKALVAHAAVFDSYSQYATDDGAVHKRFGEYWDNLEEFSRSSPNVNAANFRTPTLIMHGQLDLRVPVNQALEMFNVLQNRGVPSKFVYFPDENHWILKPQNSLFWYQTHREWLEQYVKPGPGEPVPPAAETPAAAEH